MLNTNEELWQHLQAERCTDKWKCHYLLEHLFFFSRMHYRFGYISVGICLFIVDSLDFMHSYQIKSISSAFWRYIQEKKQKQYTTIILHLSKWNKEYSKLIRIHNIYSRLTPFLYRIEMCFLPFLCSKIVQRFTFFYKYFNVSKMYFASWNFYSILMRNEYTKNVSKENGKCK